MGQNTQKGNSLRLLFLTRLDREWILSDLLLSYSGNTYQKKMKQMTI